ncbi:ABC transporter permease subunit [Microbispora sp. NPDC046933]|uniref:ABC transporter permease n=1 Tax=Microbispora sp. NPDC046933 TaxID=3155618 RepID=UPI003406E036
MRRLVSAAAPPILLGAALVAVWWIGALIAGSAVFPTPVEAVTSLGAELGLERFVTSIATTLRALASAYLAAAVVGTVAGMSLGLSAFWTSAVLPVVYTVNSIPKITLYPIFLLFAGIGDLGRGTFAFVSGVLPMFLIVVEATAAVSRVHLKLAAVLRLSLPRLLWQIVVPSVLPALATGLRLTFGLTFLGLLLAEMFSGSSGLGFEILRNVTLVRMERIVGEVILIAALALIPTLLLQALERQVHRRFGGAR